MPPLTDFLRLCRSGVRAFFGLKAASGAPSHPRPASSQDSDLVQFSKARAHHQRGELPQAQDIYQALLAKYPKDFDLLHFSGMALGQLNDFAAAIKLIEQAIATDPGNAGAHCSLGNCFKCLGQYAQALASYDKALALQPTDANAWCNRGATLQDLKRPAEALESYDRALAVDPNHVVAHDNRGTTLRHLQRPVEARASYVTALAIDPAYAPAHYNLALLMMTHGELCNAMEHLNLTVHHNPNHLAALSVLLHLMLKTCIWRDLQPKIESLRRGMSIDAASAERIVSPSIFMALPGTTAAEQRRCAERWVQFEYQALVGLRSSLALDHGWRPNEKVNIGYLSADLRDHAVARLMLEVFELHDRSRFQVTAYSYGPDDGSDLRKRLQEAFDQFIDIQGLTDVDAARRIHADRIDILVDLTGYTDKTRSGILALRPAPRQVIYLGYIGTLGADFVDYLIADHFMVPPDHRKHYAEEILYLPDCFQCNDSTRPRPPAPPRPMCDLPERVFVFCCFNQTYKITPEIFGIWCRLLIEVPDSVLWLFASEPSAITNLKREAKALGVDPDRLVMAPEVRPQAHLARHQCADLYLDTIPVNAGTTCSDALWMGLPVLTCVGDTLSSRMAGSLLTAMGVPELITHNLDDYYQLALRLATDRNALDIIRNKVIANRDTSPLFASTQFTRNLEAAYIRIMSTSPAASRHALAD